MQNDQLAARHFTTSAIHIVEQLWPRSADRGITTEITEETSLMLALLSLLRWERKVGLVALQRLGIDRNALADDVDRTLDAACAEVRTRKGPPTLQSLPSGRPGFIVDLQTPLAPLLEAAEHEALGMGHSWVGSEHILLAIVRLADPHLREVLDRHGIKYDDVRRVVLELLHS
jgi:ATP-dependent Clp protease ATP-binding subunit ClpA